VGRIRIVRSPAAREDLIDVWATIAAENRAAADRLLDRIHAKIRQLESFPDSGPRRLEIASDTRALTVGNYLVLYRHFEATVEIVRVVHGARDLTALL
jgi:toxin ParE1/3/4